MECFDQFVRWMLAEHSVETTYRSEFGTDQSDPQEDLKDFIQFQKKVKKIDWNPRQALGAVLQFSTLRESFCSCSNCIKLIQIVSNCYFPFCGDRQHDLWISLISFYNPVESFWNFLKPCLTALCVHSIDRLMSGVQKPSKPPRAGNAQEHIEAWCHCMDLWFVCVLKSCKIHQDTDAWIYLLYSFIFFYILIL